MSTRSLVMFLLLSVLAAPQPGVAKDVASAPVNAPMARATSLPLPAIPHLETIPWLGAPGRPVERQKVDTLLGPKFENIQFGLHQLDRVPGMQTRDASMERS